MKKSILILGRQGAGKTTLIHKLMSEKISKIPGFYSHITIEQFINVQKTMPFGLFSYIGIDEVASIEDLKLITKSMSDLSEASFIVSTSLPLNEIPTCLLSKFETISHL